MDGFILRASTPPTLRLTSIFFLSLFFFLTLIGLILFYTNLKFICATYNF